MRIGANAGPRRNDEFLSRGTPKIQMVPGVSVAILSFDASMYAIVLSAEEIIVFKHVFFEPSQPIFKLLSSKWGYAMVRHLRPAMKLKFTDT
jgi:hypothetical protein